MLPCHVFEFSAVIYILLASCIVNNWLPPLLTPRLLHNLHGYPPPFRRRRGRERASQRNSSFCLLFSPRSWEVVAQPTYLRVFDAVRTALIFQKAATLMRQREYRPSLMGVRLSMHRCQAFESFIVIAFFFPSPVAHLLFDALRHRPGGGNT